MQNDLIFIIKIYKNNFNFMLILFVNEKQFLQCADDLIFVRNVFCIFIL